MTIHVSTLLPIEAERLGYAKFNKGPHLCVDIPNGQSTITCKTSDGTLVTFAFCPYEQGGPPRCVDIQHHTSGKIFMNGEWPTPVQQCTIWTPGMSKHISRYEDKEPTTLIVLSLDRAKVETT